MKFRVTQTVWARLQSACPLWRRLPALVCISAMVIAAQHIAPDDYLAHIKYLASPELKGRLTGTPELNKAAEYIASQFAQSHLMPLEGNYFQDFEVVARTGLSEGDRLSVKAGGRSTELKQGIDFVPLNLSANGAAEAPVVFAGYGITAPRYRYDDYAHVDVQGRIVVILRHEPQENDPKSIFDGTNLTEHASLSSKVSNAKLHGAKGVLIVNDIPNHPADADTLGRFEPLTVTEDYGILVDQISASLAERLLRRGKQGLKEAVSEIDRDCKPDSFTIPATNTISMSVELKLEKRTTHNVLGYWPGQTDEYTILGAHYDHLGLGQQDSLAPSQIGSVHPGADDNASGTAGVLELARSLPGGGRHRRGFLFICFAGEEEGLLGSAYYAAHPLKPLSQAVAMINMDMIGRIREDKLYVSGVGTGSGFKRLVDAAGKSERLQIDESEVGGYGASDQTSFTTKQVPTLFFFSGLHSDYHKPSDTWEKINAAGAVRVLETVSDVVSALANAPERPAFVKVEGNPHSGNTSGSGYGPYFGSVPDFGGPTHGVRFSDVREGSPAAKAGLRAADVLVEFGGKPIDNLYDFTYVLRQHKPGDTVQVKVLRDGKPVTANVFLTKRQ